MVIKPLNIGIHARDEAERFTDGTVIHTHVVELCDIDGVVAAERVWSSQPQLEPFTADQLFQSQQNTLAALAALLRPSLEG